MNYENPSLPKFLRITDTFFSLVYDSFIVLQHSSYECIIKKEVDKESDCVGYKKKELERKPWLGVRGEGRMGGKGSHWSPDCVHLGREGEGRKEGPCLPQRLLMEIWQAYRGRVTVSNIWEERCVKPSHTYRWVIIITPGLLPILKLSLSRE